MRALFGLYMVSAAWKQGENGRNSSTTYETVVCQGFGSPLSMSNKAALVWSGEGAPRQVTLLLTHMVNSRIGKVFPSRVFFYVRNNTSGETIWCLWLASIMWEGKHQSKKMFYLANNPIRYQFGCSFWSFLCRFVDIIHVCFMLSAIGNSSHVT